MSVHMHFNAACQHAWDSETMVKHTAHRVNITNTMDGCNLKVNIVGYVGLNIDFLLHLRVKIVTHTKIDANSLIYFYIALRTFPPKRYVTSISCRCSWIWFCWLLLVCFVALLFAIIDRWHRLPCRKLCRNREHSGVFWIVWQASQHWWGPLHVLLCQLRRPSCHVVVRPDLSKSWSMHIYIVLLALKNVLSFLLLTLCLLTCSLAPQTWSSL